MFGGGGGGSRVSKRKKGETAGLSVPGRRQIYFYTFAAKRRKRKKKKQQQQQRCAHERQFCSQLAAHAASRCACVDAGLVDLFLRWAKGFYSFLFTLGVDGISRVEIRRAVIEIMSGFFFLEAECTALIWIYWVVTINGLLIYFFKVWICSFVCIRNLDDFSEGLVIYV